MLAVNRRVSQLVVAVSISVLSVQLKIVPVGASCALVIEHPPRAWRGSPLLTPVSSQESSWQFVSCTFPRILSSFTPLLVTEAGGTEPM